jgi:uncharacterized membrane protein
MTSWRLKIALLCYAVLAALGYMLVSGDFLIALEILLAGLAVKSYLAWRMANVDARDSSRPDDSFR